MATLQRLRANFLGGKLTTLLDASGGIIAGTGIAKLPTVTNGVNYLVLSINPDGDGGKDPEIVYVIEHVAGESTASVSRGQENTTAKVWDAGIYWQHTPTALDFDAIQTQVINTDSASGDVLRLFVGKTDPVVAGYTVSDGDVWIRME